MLDHRMLVWKRIGHAGQAAWRTVSRIAQTAVSFLKVRRAGQPRPAETRAGPQTGTESPTLTRTNRREILGTLGLWPFLGAFSGPTPGQARDQQPPQARPSRIIITQADEEEYHRLKQLDLNDPKIRAQRKKMPVGKIGELSVSRLISGSNLISMNMHARDLPYVGALATHYNTEERIFMTLKKCEELGVNTIVLKNHNFARFRLAHYWKEWGGQMRWIADVITTDIDRYEELVVEHLELGASAVYLWGGASDIWYHEKKPENIIKALEIMRKYQVPAGIGAHRLEPIAFCEKEGLAPDFYLKTLHHDRYWSAHPKEKRRYLEMYQKESEDHAEYHDNMFCHDAEQTVAFMQNVKVPWIAFKVLAAGAIPPKDGFRYAFENGADFICVGMFDWQVEEDADLVQQTVAQAHTRQRPWA